MQPSTQLWYKYGSEQRLYHGFNRLLISKLNDIAITQDSYHRRRLIPDVSRDTPYEYARHELRP